MNAVARLWEALAAGDEHRAGDELHGHVTLEWPHSGETFGSRADYLAAHARRAAQGKLELLRIVTEGRNVATDVRLEHEDGDWAIASFFHLHDGRVLRAVEYWVPLP